MFLSTRVRLLAPLLLFHCALATSQSHDPKKDRWLLDEPTVLAAPELVVKELVSETCFAAIESFSKNETIASSNAAKYEQLNYSDWWCVPDANNTCPNIGAGKVHS